MKKRFFMLNVKKAVRGSIPPEQAESQESKGRCGQSLPVFYSYRMQRRYGPDGIFEGLFCSVFSTNKRFVPVIDRKALQTGVRIAVMWQVDSLLKPLQIAKTLNFGELEEGKNRIVPQTQGQFRYGNRRKRFRRHHPLRNNYSKKK